MADENVEKEHGEKLDKILSHLDSLHSKHDALMAKHDALHARHDALEGKHEELSKRFDSLEERLKDGDTKTEREKEEREERERADKARRDAEEKERADKARHDAEEEERKRADKTRKDAEEKEEREHADKARKDAEENERAALNEARSDALAAGHKLEVRGDVEGYEEGGVFHPIRGTKGYKKKLAGDSARKDADDERIAALSSRVDSALTEIKSRLPVILPEAERSKYVEVQRRIDEVAQAFGDTAGAPRWLAGETLADYQRRLLNKYKSHSPDWKDKDLANVHESVLEIADKRIRADALAAAKSPDVPAGQLRTVRSTDVYNRTITKFYGDPAVAYAPFMFNGLIRRGRITPPGELAKH